MVISNPQEISQQYLLSHTLSLKRQSVWLEWAEQTYPFDFSWQNLIWGRLSVDVLKFVINSSVNWVRTPDLLHLWGYKKSSCCCLCGAEKCTLHHILSHCSFSLNDKRFTWRHDSVLALIFYTLMEHIEAHNKSQKTFDKPDLIQFVKAGFNKTHSQSLKTSNKNNLLSKGNDWKFLLICPT